MNQEQQDRMNKETPSNSDSNGWAALSYISFLSLFALVTKKDDEFVQFHAKQGLALFIMEIVSVALSFIFLLHRLSNFALIVCTVLSIYGLIMALRGEKKEIPVASWLVEKLNI